jgi:hypothetical protein
MASNFSSDDDYDDLCAIMPSDDDDAAGAVLRDEDAPLVPSDGVVPLGVVSRGASENDATAEGAEPAAAASAAPVPTAASTAGRRGAKRPAAAQPARFTAAKRRLSRRVARRQPWNASPVVPEVISLLDSDESSDEATASAHPPDVKTEVMTELKDEDEDEGIDGGWPAAYAGLRNAAFDAKDYATLCDIFLKEMPVALPPRESMTREGTIRRTNRVSGRTRQRIAEWPRLQAAVVRLRKSAEDSKDEKEKDELHKDALFHLRCLRQYMQTAGQHTAGQPRILREKAGARAKSGFVGGETIDLTQDDLMQDPNPASVVNADDEWTAGDERQLEHLSDISSDDDVAAGASDSAQESAAQQAAAPTVAPSATPSTLAPPAGMVMSVHVENVSATVCALNQSSHSVSAHAQFMNHKNLEVSLSDGMNIITGENGSGKSAILAAIQVALGANAKVADRGSSISNYVRHGQPSCRVCVQLRNDQVDGCVSNAALHHVPHGLFIHLRNCCAVNRFDYHIWGGSIFVERRISRSGNSRYWLKNSEGDVVSRQRQVLDLILHHFDIDASNPCCVLTQNKAYEPFL